MTEPPTEPEVTEPAKAEPPAEPAKAEPPGGGIIVRLHHRSSAEMPEGAAAVVTVAGMGARHVADLPKGKRLVQFDSLESGRYDLSVTVQSASVEIGSFRYFVDVGDLVGDVTVQIDYLRAELLVEADVETSLERRYVGTARIDSGTCPMPGPSDPVPSDLHLVTDGDRLDLSIVNFEQQALRMSGRMAPGTKPLSAAGEFASTDGRFGDWELTHLSAPTPGTVAAVIGLNDRSRSCESTMEYAGLTDDDNRSVAPAPDQPVARVEVVGHGQTWTQTLARDESVARFSGLFVGPYEVFVTLNRGGRPVENRPYSAVLTSDGTRIATTFELDWAVPPTSPLAAQEGFARIQGTFEGKSVVATGSNECTGSIPLVDTTKLEISANGAGLNLAFDSFYGKVLELAGRAEGGQGELSASGRYRSSDNKAGMWTIKRLFAPTPSTVAMLVDFDNQTDSCRATYEFAGVR